MIKHLVKLDFYAMKPLIKFILPFLIVPIILGLVVDLGMCMMVTLTFMVFMLNVVFAISERSNFIQLYSILPIKKSLSVFSRYLFSLIIIAISALISIGIFAILSIISTGQIDWVYGGSISGYIYLGSNIFH